MIRSLFFTIAIIMLSMSSGYSQSELGEGGKCAWGADKPCLAQSDPLGEPGPPPGYGPRFGEPGNHEKRGQKIEVLRAIKLLELLALDSDQEARFLPVYKQYRKDHRQVRVDRDQTINELARGLRENNLSKEDVGRLLGRIDELQMNEREITDRFHAELKPLLTIEQMGKLYVFEERFEREVLERMAKFRGGRGGMMSPPEMNDDSLYPDNDNSESKR